MYLNRSRINIVIFFSESALTQNVALPKYMLAEVDQGNIESYELSGFFNGEVLRAFLFLCNYQIHIM